jgi:hypothetical protein
MLFEGVSLISNSFIRLQVYRNPTIRCLNIGTGLVERSVNIEAVVLFETLHVPIESTNQPTNQLRGFSPRANYTDRTY